VYRLVVYKEGVGKGYTVWERGVWERGIVITLFCMILA